MKKLIILLLLTNQAFAVTFNNVAKVEVTTVGQATEVKDWMKPKNGKVIVFDKNLHVAIINQKSYVINNNTKIYDGEPVKGTRVRFNINEQNIITDLWVHKK